MGIRYEAIKMYHFLATTSLAFSPSKVASYIYLFVWTTVGSYTRQKFSVGYLSFLSVLVRPSWCISRFQYFCTSVSMLCQVHMPPKFLFHHVGSHISFLVTREMRIRMKRSYIGQQWNVTNFSKKRISCLLVICCRVWFLEFCERLMDVDERN